MSEIERAEVPSKDECVIAMLVHVLMIISWFRAPLIIYCAKRDSRFVAFHALQALYWQLIAISASDSSSRHGVWLVYALRSTSVSTEYGAS